MRLSRWCIGGVSVSYVLIFMSATSENNKRIAKNTLFLYMRMLLIMGVTLYTSRIVLQVLGVEEFGIYNVVGGVVAMFAMFSGSLSSAISRFITFELGKNDKDQLRKVFSSSLFIQFFLAIVICFLLEIVGIWFLNNKMNIPEERMLAANWVLQCSIITFILNVISIPYNAVIISHEHMKAYAYISVMDVILKLFVVLYLQLYLYDKLIMYSVLLVGVSFVTRVVYGLYCKRNFEECQFSLQFDKQILSQILHFSGWVFIGASSSLLRDQGVNVLLNIFCGPIVNAARGITMQVLSAAMSFANGFTTAINPQITKSYALNKYEEAIKLVFRGSRFSFYLTLLITFPILMETQRVLELWLGHIPEYTVLFVRIGLIWVLVESISYAIMTLLLATGKIRKYQLLVGGLQMLNFPLSYLALWMGLSPECTFIIAVIIAFGCLLLRLYVLNAMMEFPVFIFFKTVIFNILKVSVVSVMFPVLFISNMDPSIKRFLSISILSIISSLMSIYYVGCTQEERLFLLNKMRLFSCKLRR